MSQSRTLSRSLSLSSPPPSILIDDAVQTIEDSEPLRAIVDEVEKPHSPPPSPETDERNREYLIRRAALGDNPTKEQMDAIVAYGLEQHRIYFPHFYQIQCRFR